MRFVAEATKTPGGLERVPGISISDERDDEKVDEPSIGVAVDDAAMGPRVSPTSNNDDGDDKEVSAVQFVVEGSGTRGDFKR